MEKWQRRIISGVLWTDTQGAAIRKAGVKPEDKTTIIIPQDALNGYVTPKAFAAAEDKAGIWTVAPQDTVVLGAAEVDIVTTPAKDLVTVDNVRQITGIDSNLHGGLAHLEVRAK